MTQSERSSRIRQQTRPARAATAVTRFGRGACGATLLALSACSFHSLEYLQSDSNGGSSGSTPGDGTAEARGGADPGAPGAGGRPGGGQSAGGLDGVGASGLDGSPDEAPTASCTNLLKDGAETDLDCGGACPACKDGQHCAASSDCVGDQCLAGSCATAPSCTDATCILTDDARYVFHPGHNLPMCADDRGRNLFNGASVIQYACNGQSGQQFAALNRGNGYYAFKNVLSGKCLEVRASSTAPNAATDLYTCSYGDNQLWLVSATSNGLLKLTAKHSLMVLDVQNAISTVSDLPLVQSVYDGSLDMQWQLVELAN